MIRFRDFSAKNIKLCTDNIGNDIAQLRACLNMLNTIDDNVLYLTFWIGATVDKYFPHKSKTVCRRCLMSPWVYSRIINLINKNHQLFGDFRNILIIYSSLSSAYFLFTFILGWGFGAPLIISVTICTNYLKLCTIVENLSMVQIKKFR